ncbi:MAG: hypothetical protein R3B06_11430 [Kofleriaceae bacterium]
MTPDASMMMRLWELVLAAIMGLTGFSIAPNPKAPPAAVVLAPAVDEADLVVHLDLKPTLIDNYPVLAKLADEPLVAQAPELADGVRQALAGIEAGRSMVKGLVGIDPATDLTSLTWFVQVAGTARPNMLLVVRGKVPADLPTRLAQNVGGTAVTIDGRAAASTDDGLMLGLTRDGALLIGTRAWVEPRLHDGWKTPARPRGSSWELIGKALDARPFLLVASKPSAGALQLMAGRVPDSFGKELLTQHTLAIVALTATGMSWTYQARDAAFAARFKLASEGWIELMRAAHIVPRGLAALVVAALPSYAGRAPALDAVIRDRDRLRLAVSQLTGDGKFAATVTQQGTLVTVAAKGRRLSEVLPIGLVVGLGGLGAFTMRASDAPPAAVGPAPTEASTPVRMATPPRHPWPLGPATPRR